METQWPIGIRQGVVEVNTDDMALNTCYCFHYKGEEYFVRKIANGLMLYTLPNDKGFLYHIRRAISSLF